MRTAAIEGGQAFFQHFFVFIAYTADIAHEMGGQLTVRIFAECA